MFVRMVPFSLGYWIMSFFIPVYNKEIVAFNRQHPAMANRIAEEFEKNGSQINAKTLKNVPFTSFFIKEVLSLVFKLIAREILPNDRFVLFTMQFRHFHFENLSQNYSYNRLSTIS